MTRRRVLLIVTVVAGAWLGGFHEWVHPHQARAANFCFDYAQFTGTYALDGQPPPTTFIVGVNGQAEFGCSSNWRVTFTPLYQDAAGWHRGFSNDLYMPSATGHYAASQSTYFQAGVTPPDFTGYWTNGDGLLANHPICQYPWRVRERFTNTGNGTLLNTLYSPTVAATC